MELSQSQNPRQPVFPPAEVKGQPAVKMPAVHLAHLEEESAKKNEEVDSEDPDSIEGVTGEFMVCLVMAMKDAQKEKHCYHCSSLEHFICDCPLVQASRTDSHLNHKEGMAPMKGAQIPWMKVTMPKTPQRGCPRYRAAHTDSLLESWSIPAMVWGPKKEGKVKIKGESCMALLDNGVQVNTIMPSYVKSHSLEVGPITNLAGRWVTCIGLEMPSPDP